MEASEAANRINWRLLAPILIVCVLMQICVPLARVSTSYAAIDLGLPASSLAMLSAAFALLPIAFAVRIGRMNDRYGSEMSGMAGALIITLAMAGYAALAHSFWSLFLLSALLGLGQLLLLSALQLSVSMSAVPSRRDAVLGNFTVAMALGQFIGPLFLGVLSGDAQHPDVRMLFLACGSVAIAMTGLTVVVARASSRVPRLAGTEGVLPISTLLRTNGLIWIVLASSLIVAINDLILVYVPLLGTERSISAGTIGLLLATRAVASMAARILLVPAVTWLGRKRVMVTGFVMSAAALTLPVLPLPAWTLYPALGASGFALGLAGATAFSLLLIIAPAHARATALSVRLTASRLGQVAIPMAMSGVAVLGAGPVFGAMAFAVAAMAVLAQARITRQTDDGGRGA